MRTVRLSAHATAATRPDGVRTRPLSPALGAEIMEVDLSSPMDDPLFETIEDIWHKNLVILLRDQDLTEDDQVRFGERFGPPAVSHTKRFTTANPAVMLTAARMARVLIVAPATKSGGSILVPQRNGLPASRARNVSSKRWRWRS